MYTCDKKVIQSEVLSCGGGFTVVILKFWYLAVDRRGCHTMGAIWWDHSLDPEFCLFLFRGGKFPSDLMSFW